MKKTLIALSIFAFVGSIAIASNLTVNNGKEKTELADGGKKKKKKSECAKDCAKECCAKDKAAATGEKAACTKDATKSCCSKDKAKAAEGEQK
jgi:hypothetical protein